MGMWNVTADVAAVVKSVDSSPRGSPQQLSARNTPSKGRSPQQLSARNTPSKGRTPSRTPQG
eukprot:79657-Prorocentrum_minimum.AAC.2